MDSLQSLQDLKNSVREHQEIRAGIIKLNKQLRKLKAEMHTFNVALQVSTSVRQSLHQVGVRNEKKNRSYVQGAVPFKKFYIF